MGMFDSLLIANRGEIARRVIRTARRMGLRTIAVYSEPDAELPFVTDADEAVLIGPADAGRSYRNVDAILAAAKETGAQAIHPGYGFLSENPDFAAAAAASTVATGTVVPGAMGTPTPATRLRAATLSAIAVIACSEGPTHTRPACTTAAAKSGFSDRKP